MNIKQFKKKWLMSKIEPELFYMPMKKEEDIPLIFDIYVHEDGKFVTCFNTCINDQYPLNYNVSGNIYAEKYIYYQPRNSEGVYVTPETHPDLFHTAPFTDEDFASPPSINEDFDVSPFTPIASKFSTLRTSFSEPYLEVDWGDGSITRTTTKENNLVIINGEKYTYSCIQRVFEDDTFTSSEHWYHKYEKSGRYTIKVKGNIMRFYFEQHPSQTEVTLFPPHLQGGVITGRCNLLKIHQWGDLHVKDLFCMFSFLVNDSEHNLVNKSTFEGYPEINWEQYRNVISINNMFFLNSYNNNNNNEFAYMPMQNLTWDFLPSGERFFDNFPNIISASFCFFNNSFDYIPQDCFKNNPYLTELDHTFYSGYKTKPFKYIGKNACKDLHYLKGADYCFAAMDDDYYNKGVEVIEDGVFENCYVLGSYDKFSYQARRPFGAVPFIKTVGNRVFANCYHITDVSHMFDGCSLLSKVGNEVFENCHNLSNCSYLFDGCGNLQHIGNNIFKGCHSIQDVSFMFDGATRLHYIPDDFLSDVQNQTINAFKFLWDATIIFCDENWSFETSKGYEYGTDEFFNRQIMAVGAFDGVFNLKFYRQYYPEEAQDIFDYYNNLTIDDVYLHLGKNMFNKTCSVYDIDLSTFCATYSVRQGNSNTHYTKYLFKGEAPLLWTINNVSSCSDRIFGTEAGTVSYTYTDLSGQLCTGISIYEHSYDNYEDIPKQSPWLYPLD